MKFEGNFESNSLNESRAVEKEPEIISPEIRHRIEVENLEVEIDSKEELIDKISSAPAEEPKVVEKDKAPGDLDLVFMNPDKIQERKEFLLERYKEAFDKIRPVGKEIGMEKPYKAEKSQNIDYDNLVFVRADDFPPVLDSSENLKIINPEEATKGEVPRITSHFTLNHRVSSNNGGSWQNRPYQYIIPGRAMVEKNGEPTNLYSIDTFYANSVSLPEGAVILYEKGKKPEIPDSFGNKLVLIERGEEANDSELVSLIIEKMGYTNILGGGRYSNTDNIDSLIGTLAKSRDLRSGSHEFSWCQYLEDARFAVKDRDFVSAKNSAQMVYDSNYGHSGEEQRKMPDELKTKIWADIFGAFKFDNSEFEKAEDAKRSIEEWIEKALNRKSVDLEIPDKDRAIILEQVPREGWAFIIGLLKENVQNKLFDDIEAKGIFDESFKKPFREITNKDLEINYE